MPQQLRLVSALLLAFVVAVATDDSGCYETWHKTWLTIRAMNPDITTYDPETTTFRATHSGPTTYEIPIFFREGSNRAELTALAKHVYTLYPHAITDAVDYMMELLETSANKIPDKLPCDDGVPDGASLVRPASAPPVRPPQRRRHRRCCCCCCCCPCRHVVEDVIFVRRSYACPGNFEGRATVA